MRNLLYIILFFAFSSHSQNLDNNRRAIIARCFFVYAPLYQVAKKMNDEKLLNYSLQRMMYLKGLLGTLKDDGKFKVIFEKNLKKNKADAQLIEDDLIKSLYEKNAVGYNNVLRKGEVCDKELGI